MSKLKIAVLFGGCSEEHDVSIKSAQEIAKNINTEKYEPIYIGITRSGVWKMCESPSLEWENESGCSVVIPLDREMHGLILLKDGKFQIRHIDVVFPVLHGKMGEDGTIQGLLDLSSIPYIGCDIQSSVLCMDKSLAHMVIKDAGIATPMFWTFDYDHPLNIDAFTYPLFVKPARSGSSFGITKVNSDSELLAAIESAKLYDSKIVIEQAIFGIEVGCAVMGNGSELSVGEVDQIDLTHGFFRIHQEIKPEVGSENAIITVPANLPLEKREQIQETAKLIYRALGCRGLARVDMFLQKDGSVVFNEVNTLPGFTSYSRFPCMMAAAGITLSEVIDQLIVLALEG